MQVQLIVAKGSCKGQIFHVNLPTITIGSAKDCNLCSPSRSVSPYHCIIQIDNGSVTVQDLGGENGTFVNGNRITAVHTLNDEDKLGVGKHTFTVSIQATAEQTKAGQSETNPNDFFELPDSVIMSPQNNSAAFSPFVLTDLDTNASESTPFHAVRIARKENTRTTIWNTLDISFSRVYTTEGSNLAIHCIKAFYYIVVVICLLTAIFASVQFFVTWFNNGNIPYISTSVSVFGSIMIVVIVRVFLEMVLLAWFDSAKREKQKTEKKDRK